MVHTALLISSISTTLFALLSLIATALVVYRVFKFERARLNDAETSAFRLMDEMLRSLMPRNLGRRLAELNRVNLAAGVTTDDAALVNKPDELESKNK